MVSYESKQELISMGGGVFFITISNVITSLFQVECSFKSAI